MSHKYHVLNFQKRILEMDSHRLIPKVYVWSCSFADQGIRNWVCKTRSMMNSFGHQETPSSSGNIWEALALKTGVLLYKTYLTTLSLEVASVSIVQ